MTEDLVQKATDKVVPTNPATAKNTVDAIAMARTADPDSAAQFFINLADNGSLDYKNGQYGYTVFGRVESGMDTVSKIARVKTATRGFYQNVPVQPVKIRRVVVGQ